jgi:hypothetical protein
MAVKLRDEAGNPFWPTPGRYINRKMLLAFIEELGHRDYFDLLGGATCQNSGDATLLLDVASRKVAEKDKQGRRRSNERDSYV